MSLFLNIQKTSIMDILIKMPEKEIINYINKNEEITK